MTIELERQGRRTYLIGDTFPQKDKIKDAGGKWDPNRKAWWLSKHEAAEALVTTLSATAAAEPQNEFKSEAPFLKSTIAGRAFYKGQTYYLAGRVIRGRVTDVQSQDGSRALLYSRGGSRQFWAPRDKVQTVKAYSKPTTIEKLQAFAAEARESGSAELAACKRRGWDGKIGSPSYYSSGAFDDLDQ